MGGTKSCEEKRDLKEYYIAFCLPIPLQVIFGFMFSDIGGNELHLYRCCKCKSESFKNFRRKQIL